MGLGACGSAIVKTITFLVKWILRAFILPHLTETYLTKHNEHQTQNQDCILFPRNDNPSMEDLPENVIYEILSRLPIITITRCKSVCNKWLNLISDPYFANLHLVRPPAGLMIYHQSVQPFNSLPTQGILKRVEIEDELDHHHLQHNPVLDLDLNLVPIFKDSRISPVGSINGLICIRQFGRKADNIFICNPITREYMILPRQQYYAERPATIIYGFGIGSRTKEYKVVRTFQGDIPHIPNSLSRPSLIKAEVYTLGTGKWRTLGRVPYWFDGYDGPFLDGHVHWIVLDEDSPETLCSFNFDKETFQLFPSPPSQAFNQSLIRFQSLAVLKGCLSQSVTTVSEFTIWVMKEYGVKKSWYKEVVIKQSISPDLSWLMIEPVYLIEALKDGTILMLYYLDEVLAYCPRTNTFEKIDFFKQFDPPFIRMTYQPSDLTLRNFESERVVL